MARSCRGEVWVLAKHDDMKLARGRAMREGMDGVPRDTALTEGRRLLKSTVRGGAVSCTTELPCKRESGKRRGKWISKS